MKLKNHISYQILKIAFAIFLFFSVFVTLFQMFMEYTNAQKHVTGELSLLQSLFEQSLSTSLFERDDKQLASMIKNMYHVPSLIGLKIISTNPQMPIINISSGITENLQGKLVKVDEEGAIIPIVEKVGELIKHRFPIYKPYTKVQIAEAIFYSSYAVVFSKVKNSFILVIVSMVVEMGILYLLFLWISNQLSQSLQEISSTLEKANNSDNLQKIQIDSKAKQEWIVLGKAFNNILNNLSSTQGELRTLNLELEQKISERTVELIEAKNKAETASRAKNTFLANISHELRSPLNTILGYTQIYQLDKKFMAKNERAIEAIHNSGKYMLNIIEDILDIAKIETSKIKLEQTHFALQTFIKTIVEMAEVWAKLKNISLTCNVPLDMPVVCADEKRLRQILLNLLSNAIKFTDKGIVNLAVKVSDFGDGKQKFCFMVKDTGRGIDSKDLREVFLPFHQVGIPASGSQGSGLGLAISEKLVCLMDSELSVMSTIGKGSSFWFEVVLATSFQKDKNTSERHIISFKGKPKTILLVDHETDNRNIIKNMLVPLGFFIQEVDNAAKALDITKSFCPDLLFLDLGTLKMEVVHFIKCFRENTSKDIPIIIISAEVFEYNQQKIIAIGGNEFITKPIQFELLFSVLKKYLQLEWNYENIDNTLEKQLIIPNSDELEELLMGAKRQHVSAIRKILEDMKQQDERYVPFVATIESFVKEYNFSKMVDFIKDVCS